MKKNLLILFSLSFFVFPFFSQEIKFSGEVGTVWGMAVRSENRGDFILGDTYVKGKLDAFYEKSSAYAEGKVGFDEVAGSAYYSLREIWLDYTSDFWGIRIGRQKTAWGKADGIDITNVICPHDYSSTIAIFNDEYRAIDAARLSLNNGNFSLDAYVIPFTDFAEKKLANAEYGIKCSGYFSHCDFSLYGFYGFDETPFYPSGEYEKITMFGSDFAIPLGEAVLRLEGAFFPARHFQTSAEKILLGKSISETHHNIRALAGIDWMPSSWTLTAQYFCDGLFGATENLFRTENYTHGATLSVSKSLFNETLTLSASGVLNLNDFDSALEFSAEYSLSDSIFIEAGGYIFNEGKESGVYGAYKNLSCAYLKARYVF
ncbi:MAG: hypothetical protein IJ158_06035 [Treponema sp.]|nr:hypothetical protein [Treponema sp.]